MVGGGAVGLCVLQALKATGAGDVIVIDKSSAKEALAIRLGADAFLKPSVQEFSRIIREMTDGIGVDVAFECVGSAAALRTAFAVTRSGGTICLVGIFPEPFEFDFNLAIMQEQTVVSSLGYSDEFPSVISMLSDGRLRAEPLITRTVSLEEGVEVGIKHYEASGITNVRTLIDMER